MVPLPYAAVILNAEDVRVCEAGCALVEFPVHWVNFTPQCCVSQHPWTYHSGSYFPICVFTLPLMFSLPQIEIFGKYITIFTLSRFIMFTFYFISHSSSPYLYINYKNWEPKVTFTVTDGFVLIIISLCETMQAVWTHREKRDFWYEHNSINSAIFLSQRTQKINKDIFYP